jgi:ClpP class serine protease
LFEKSPPLLEKVKEEENQYHPTRKNLYRKIEKLLGCPVVSLFTSFVYPVMLEDDEADMLEQILRCCDLSKGFALMINSPGGSGLAAERIINVCKAYSGNGEYSAIVPGKAKSAATMVCFGASKIIMGKTSELGPIDPQVTIEEDKKTSLFSVNNIVKSYESLFDRAVNSKGHLEPFIQQLSNYDEREIAEFKSALALSDDIAIRALKGSMLKNMPENEIKSNIGIFLIPEERTVVHGRPIYADEAKDCKLNIDLRIGNDALWKLVYELYIRLDNYVSINRNAKVVECYQRSYAMKYRDDINGS